MKVVSKHSTLLRPRKQESVPYILRCWGRRVSVLTTPLIASVNPWREKPRRNERGNDNEKEHVLSWVHGASFSEVAKTFHIEVIFLVRRFVRFRCLEARKFFINLRLLRLELCMRLLEFRMRLLERRMVVFKRLSLIAEKCENRLDVGDGSLVRNEIVELLEKVGETHKGSDLSSTPSATSLSSVAEDHNRPDQ